MFTITLGMWYSYATEVSRMNLRNIIMIALFAALLAAGAYVTIPIGPVPITLQSAFVLLAGILCGKRIASGATATYLALGAIGLPVFSGGIGGFAHLAGPTGGFLISWLIAAPITGMCADAAFRHHGTAEHVTRKELVWIILGVLLGTVVIHAIGLPYLKLVLNVSWAQALSIGTLPFIPGDLIKAFAVVILGNLFALRVRDFIAFDDTDTMVDHGSNTLS